MKYIQFFVILLLFLSNISWSNDGLMLFAGPSEGRTYLYNISGGGVLEVTGLPSHDLSVKKVEEVVYLERLALPKGDGPPHTKYSLYLSNNSLIKKNSKGEMVLLKGPLKPGAEKWKTIGQIQEKGRTHSITFLCGIIDVYRKALFDKDRLVVTVKCKMKRGDLSTVIVAKYAEGIGLLEKSTESMLDGKSFGVQMIVLSEIQ